MKIGIQLCTIDGKHYKDSEAYQQAVKLQGKREADKLLYWAWVGDG